MTGKEFYQEINNLEDALLLEADEPYTFKKTAELHWKKMIGIAACLILILGATIVGPKLLSNGTYSVASSENALGHTETDNAILYDYADIYYVENGAILKKAIQLQYTPQTIFAEWKKLNHIPNEVKLTDCKIDSNGHELPQSSSTAGYVVGDTFILNATLSREFLACFNSTNKKDLVESLVKTLSYGYVKYKEVNIYVDGQEIN